LKKAHAPIPLTYIDSAASEMQMLPKGSLERSGRESSQMAVLPNCQLNKSAKSSHKFAGSIVYYGRRGMCRTAGFFIAINIEIEGGFDK
jgi:hypothetical protein